ncbi:DNA polymerase/3'-5' exonuclease PolX [Methylocapsa acidiphila]|uniref:DNA polymerase/3'-5' exonuclease PolX n=1 Tax=Methylocapsa acidiphila TaxID=133552 RepID=UPI0004096272|nr:DNA polymerase/3'-5' exonuclease PolX [Methylocapsa acidiphila]
MPVHNAEIAAMLDQAAELLEIGGADPVQSRAYRRAARAVEGLPTSAETMLKAGVDLSQLPGIGKRLAGEIAAIVATGKFDLLERLKNAASAELAAIAAIRGLGPKRAKLIHEKLGVGSIEDLRRVVSSGRLRKLRGFGPKLEQAILGALDKPVVEKRFKLRDAEAEAMALIDWLRSDLEQGRALVAGSFRRRRESVGDLDILMTSAQASRVGNRLAAYENVAHVSTRGAKRATVVLRSGLRVDLRVTAEESYGAALLYLTGSKAHNVALRNRALERGLKLNEHGLFHGERRIAGATEEEIYASLGLAFTPPELREDRGEIALAGMNMLPHLVSLSDIRGDLHIRSNWGDGDAPIADMVAAAAARGYSYVCLTDHSRRRGFGHGSAAERLLRRIDEIDRINAQSSRIAALKGVEVDILADGRLDLPDKILSRLDLVIAAVRSKFDLSRERQTERIIRAMDNRHVSILAHPTSRLIGARAPCEVDMERVILAAHERGCHLELCARLDRPDLGDLHAQAAKAMGVKVAISTDARSTAELDDMRYGVDQARRGWLEPSDVINTRPLPEVKKLLAR